MFRRTIIAITAVLVCINVAAAQEFNVLSVDDSNYPTMKARVSAVYSDGTTERDNLNAQLSILENGIPVASSAICNEPQPGTVDVVLVNDLSLSMGNGLRDGSGRTRMDLVKIGAQTFLNDIVFDGNIRVALTGFHYGGELLSGFTEDRVLLNSIVEDFIWARTAGTNYDSAFLSPYSGALELLKDSPADRKIVVFLTDGAPKYEDCGEDCVDSTQIMQKSQQYGVNIYAVTVQFEFTKLLQRISDESGGAAFGEITSEEEARNAYKQIAEAVQGKLPCEVTWESPELCGEQQRLRTAEFIWQPDANSYTDQYSYLAPSSSVAKLEVESSAVSFGNPELLAPEFRELRYTARNSDFDILSLEPIVQAGTKFQFIEWQMEGDIGWNTDMALLPGNVIPRDKFLAIRVRFVQEDAKDLRLATVELLTSPCDPSKIELIAGGASSNTSLVTLVSPRASEFYNSCDGIHIQWSVDPPERPVDIFYREAGSSDWILIEQNYPSDPNQGVNEYEWFPQVTGDLEVQVVAAGEYPQWIWAWQGKSSNEDEIVGLALLDEAAAVVGKAGSSSLDFGMGNLAGAGQEFIVKIDASGQTESFNGVTRLSGNTLIGAASNDMRLNVAKEQRTQAYRPNTLNFIWGSSANIASSPGFGEPENSDIAMGQSYVYVMGNLQASNADRTPYGYVVRYRNDTDVTPNPDNRWNVTDWTDASRQAAEQVFHGIDIGPGERVHVYGDIKDKDDFNGKDGLSSERPFVASFTDPDDNNTFEMRSMPVTATPLDIAVSITGETYLGGRYTGNPTFDNGVNLPLKIGAFDGYIIQYDQSLQAQWAVRFTPRSGGEASVEFVDVDADGNCYVLGYFDGSELNVVSTDGSQRLSNTDQNFTELFAAKISNTGALLWAVSAGGTRNELANGLRVDPVSGDVTLAGVFASGTNAGNATFGSHALTNSGQGDIFVSRIRTWKEGSDATEGSFNVSTPVISFVAPDDVLPWVLPAVAQGGLSQKTFTLRNDGNIDLLLDTDKLRIDGDNAFQVNSLSKTRVAPGEEFTIELSFQAPNFTATLSADLVIEGACIDEFIVPLEAEILNPCGGDFGSDISAAVRVGQTEDVVVSDVFSVSGTESYQVAFQLSIVSKQQYAVSALSAIQEGVVVTVDNANPFPPITLEFTPDRVGTGQFCEIIVTRIGCDAESLLVDGEGVPGDPVLDVDVNELDFGTLFCADENTPIAPRNVTVTNTGGGSMDVVVTPPASFGLSPGSFTLAEGQSQVLDVTINPSGDQLDYSGDLIVVATYLDTDNNEQTLRDTVQLSGRNEIRRIEFVSTETFGSVAGPFPLERRAEIRNTGNVDFTVTATMLQQPPFTLLDQNIMVAAGSTESIRYTFDDPGDNAVYTSTITLTSQDLCGGDVMSSEISAQVAQGIADVRIDDITANVRTRNVGMPINIAVAAGFRTLVTTGTQFTAEVRFDRTVFSPQRVAAGLCTDPVMNVTSEGVDNKTILVSVTGSTPDLEANDGVLFTVFGDMLIGATTTSTIEFSVPAWEQLLVDVRVDAGIIEGEGLCQAGGTTRFVEKREYTPIESAQFNGTADAFVVDVEVIQGGEYGIEVFDMTGRRVMHTFWTESGVTTTEGVRSVRKTLPAFRVPQGTYVLVFTAPRSYNTVVLPVLR